MYYVITKGGGGGVRKGQFLITFSTESNHKGGRGGGQKNQNLDYVIHGCSPTSSILEQRLYSVHHLQMISSEGFQYHFTIISKFACCGCYMKKNVVFTRISFTLLK